MLWIILGILFLILCYQLFSKPHNYWLEKGIKQDNPVSFFQIIRNIIQRKYAYAEKLNNVYKSIPGVRYFGMYEFKTPVLVVRDPELIKQITVKDFDHFVDHKTFLPENCDPLWSRNLFALTGKSWRDMRGTLSPAFTSSKMKYMFSLISQSGEQFVNYFLEKKSDFIEFEMRDTFGRFTTDVIANMAFGVQCDSLRERNNQFLLMSKDATNFSGLSFTFRFMSLTFLPKLAKFLNFKFFSKEVSDFFINVVKSNIENRKKHNIVRPDMIHLLLEARKNGLKQETTPATIDTGFATAQESEITKSNTTSKIEITDIDIAAQALLFFLGGFDTVASSMCFTGYELAVNPDVQQKLIDEVDETWKACNGKLTYEALLNMKYMDMVLSEALRKWPNSVRLDRVCTKPYTIEPKTPDERPLQLKENDLLWIPTFSIHRDPAHFPDPDKFDPERFNQENKDKILPYTYFPFGSGPRNCIGSRFALLEIKTLFFNILSNFEIVPTEKSTIPVVLNPKSFTLASKDGFWFGLKRRTRK